GQLFLGRASQEARAIGRERGVGAVGRQAAQVDQQRHDKAAKACHLGSVQRRQASDESTLALQAQLAVQAQWQGFLGSRQQDGDGGTQCRRERCCRRL